MKLMLTVSLAVMATVVLAQTPPGGGTASQKPAQVISEVLAAQVMLDRSGFSPGEIDGQNGDNVKRAVAAFQRANKVPESGELDEHTWQRLTQASGSQPPLVSYELRAADLAGPFTAAIPSDLLEQSQLATLGYQNPLELIAERFHASAQLLKRMNMTATFDRPGETVLVPNVQPFELPQPTTTDQRSRTPGTPTPAQFTIAVTKSTSALTVEDSSGQLLFHAPVTTGSEHDPLPVGTWMVTGIDVMPAFHYNPALFWDANPAHSKAKIQPGPNNPVGIAWIDLNKEHYGIHGTPEPSRIGHVQSHGCVRLTNWDVQRLLKWAQPGTPVVFRE